MSDDRKPLDAICSKCRHEWTFAWTPISIDDLVAMTKNAKCPACGNSKQLLMKCQPK